MYAASGKFGKYSIYVNTTILIHKKALEKLKHSGKAAVGRPKNKKTPGKKNIQQYFISGLLYGCIFYVVDTINTTYKTYYIEDKIILR